MLTPQWGPRIRFGTVLTDAPLEGGRPLSGELCTDCDLCIEACPVGAISPGGSLDCLKCVRSYQPYGLSHLLGFLSRFVSRTDEEKQKALRNPLFWNAYQSLLLETGFCGCFECVKACPLGE